MWRCGLELHFPDRDDTEHSFVCLLAICMSPFEKCQVLCPFMNWIFLFFFWRWGPALYKRPSTSSTYLHGRAGGGPGPPFTGEGGEPE